MEKKYKTKPEGNMLRIIALKNFSNIKKGDKGGLIEKEENLSQEGDCWVLEDAKVFGNARVYENAKVFGEAVVYESARVYGDGKVYGNAMVCGKAEIYGKANVFGNACVSGNAKVCGNVKLYSTYSPAITASIESNEDYVILAFKKDFYVTPLPSNILLKSLIDYLKNIQTIRQLYGKEV